MQKRLNKFLADSGCCSRRKADELISHGQVSLNGQIVTELGIKVDPDTDKVQLDGKDVNKSGTFVYYALNKPKGVLSTASDDLGRPTVLDLVPKEIRVYPVGRLDEDSSGLMILTNDGELTQRLTHPSFKHEKEYEVLVRKSKDLEDIDSIKKAFVRGLRIDDKLMKADKIAVIENPLNPKLLTLNLIIHTGYNRQIRRMCAKIGLEVVKLTRIRLGKLTLSDLKLQPGEYKEISKNDIL